MLIALLIAISLGVWFQSFRIFEREPRAQQIAVIEHVYEELWHPGRPLVQEQDHLVIYRGR